MYSHLRTKKSLIKLVKMSYIIKIICFLIYLLPETRCFILKTKLLSFLGFEIDKSARVVSSITIIGKPKLKVGRSSYIGHYFKCYGDGAINIGSDIDIAPEVSIITGTHEVNYLGGKVAGNGRCDDVEIGCNSWICSRVLILGGTKIGNDCLVAPGSVLKGEYESGMFIAGNPAKCVCSLDDLYKGKYEDI